MSYKLTPDKLKEMIPKIEEGARSGDDALCRVFALCDDPDFYLLFTSRQHKECLEFLQREIGRALTSVDVAWVGSLESEGDKQLMLFSGGSSFGKEYENDRNVGRLVQARIVDMLMQIESDYSLR